MRPHLVLPRAALILAVAVSLAGPVRGQGLLGIGNEGSRVTQSIPLKVGFGAWAGYDSNANTAPSGEAEETAFYGGRATLRYAYVTKETRFDLRFQFAGLRQDAGGGSLDDLIYNTRLGADLAHRFDQRTSLTNNALIAWEVEPDFMVGASTSRRDDQYLYLYDRAALWLSLTNRLTSVTSYTAEGIRYESGPAAASEDRFSHTVGQQLRFAWSDRSTVKAEYRFGVTNYDSAPLDSRSQQFLAGLDQQFGQSALLTLLAGAEHRDYDDLPGVWKPRAEVSLLHRLSDATTLQWLSRAALEDTEVLGYENRYSIRTGLSVSHRLSDRLAASAGVAYVHGDLEGRGGSPDGSERGVQAHAELTYALLPNLDLATGYQFTDYGADDASRDYDRHRVSVAATTTF